MNPFLNEIINNDWQQIINIGKTLSDSERHEAIDSLKMIDIDKDILKKDGGKLIGQERKDFYERRVKLNFCLNFSLIVCTRNYSDIKRLESKKEDWVTRPFYNYISSSSNYQPLIEFYKLFPPEYLNNVISDIKKDRFGRIDFKLLWKWYQNKWVDFDESFFLRSLIIITMFYRDTREDADFLYENPKALQDVLLKFHLYELPILDLSKWEAREGSVCKKICEFWTEVFEILIEKGYQFDRSIISNLFESLLNNWKKPHLDWLVRLIEIFKPTDSELIKNQDIIFSILGAGQTSLINYSIHKIQIICNLNEFDKIGFINNFPLIFSNEKCQKSIIIGLDILEDILKKSSDIDIEYREQLAILLLQADTKIQEKATAIILKYFKDDELQQILTPYLPNLKQNAIKLLNGIDKPIQEEIIEFENDKNIYPEVSVPATWEELLFQVGNCIRTTSALDYDLFYEGLNKLQDEIPFDFERQLKPYTKLLFNKPLVTHSLVLFSNFLESWVKGTRMVKDNGEYYPVRFVGIKSEWLLMKLETKNKLPFLSTPTHEPFYLHPNALLDRLLQYENIGSKIFLEDLIVGCNRLMINDINNEVIEKSKMLKGFYAKAIQYYVGATNSIDITNETLPLWSQITRIKNPNKVFPEFSNTKAKNYPTVIKPFDLDFKVTEDANQYATWYRLNMDENWNYSWYRKRNPPKIESLIYYNAAYTGKGFRSDIKYQMSLNPLYVDAIICRYIPDTASGNEVDGFEACLYPMQFLLDHKLKVYHNGWLYIAVCLLFEKKISRDLASDFIELSLLRNENLDDLAIIIGKLIGWKFAPINRLIEYFDKPMTGIKIKRFQHKVMASCISNFGSSSLPTNSKKLISYYKEWSSLLGLENEIEAKEKSTGINK